MSLIIPDSTVNMYADVPISAGHQLVFSSRNAQNNYFLNHRIVSKAGCSYIRKTGRLRIEFNAARVQQCNYMSFTNTSFENVTFYAHILDYEYVNNETTDIIYEIDYWQTYMFDAKFHSCSILREHLTEADYQKAVKNPWRRDIPELLTDEGLPCAKNLEKIYTSNLSSYTGEQFRIPSKISADDSDNMVLCMFLSSFDIEAIVTNENTGEINPDTLAEYNAFLDNFNYYVYNEETISGTTVKKLRFNSWSNNFGMTYSVMAIKINSLPKPVIGNKATAAMNNMNKAIEFLTAYGITSSIVGLYVLPEWIFNVSTAFESNAPGREVDVRISRNPNIDPKLNTYPFSYLRVSSPLDTKEYRLDLFTSMSDGEEYCPLLFSYNLNGVPAISISPINYGRKVTSDDNYLKSNYDETITFQAFPQMGFSCDAFLTFLSQQYASAMTSNTMAGQSSLIAAQQESMAGQGAAALGAVASPIAGFSDVIGNIATGNFGNAVSSGFGMGNLVNEQAASIARAQANYEQSQQSINIQNEAQGSRLNGSGVFYGTKRAFVNDKYTKGSASGYLPYQFNSICFWVTIVTLNDDILQKYHDYLTLYGYKSLRNGVPHVCDYVTDGSNVPHFSVIDNETFTYVQTEDMHVTGLQQVACSYIENLFNAGCRFLKGD